MNDEAVRLAAEFYVLEYLQRDIEYMDIVEMLDENPGGENLDAGEVLDHVHGLLSDAAMILSDRYSEK